MKTESTSPQTQDLEEGRNHALYKALSHPIRYRILMALGEVEASPKELSELLEHDFHRVCEQVRILRDAGFIELVAEDQRRGGTQHFYKATVRPLLDADEWAEFPLLARESISVSILRIIFDDVAEALKTGDFDAHPHRALLQKPMIVDEQGYEEADASALRHLAELNKIAAESAGRLIRNGKEGIPIKTATIIHTAASHAKTGLENP
ncbi:MAG TPA: hypothetical protein VMS11_13255 [Solirubrobacterales bacterium]|nr:hypothetical protein [Solirubrobacterales bacterium]